MNCHPNRIITFASLAIAILLASSARAQGPRAKAAPTPRDPATWNQPGVVVPDASWSPIGEPAPPREQPPDAADRKTKPEDKSRWDEHHGLFGPVRFGPVIGTGLPNVLNYGVTAKLWGYVGLGLNWGQTPEMQFSFYGDATVRYREFDGYARVYPFRGGFFVGVGAGHHRVDGSIVNSVQVPAPTGTLDYGYSSTGSVRSTIVTPQLGYFRNFAFGLALGIDIGAQIPIKSSDITLESTLSSQVPPMLAAQAEKPVRDTLGTIGRTPLPSVNLRIGWLF